MQLRVRTLLLLPALYLAACRPAGPADLTDADRAAIRSVTDSFSARMVAGNFDGLMPLYTADAALLPPNAPTVRGREAIKTFIASFPPVKSLRLTIDTIAGAGDFAYARGRYLIQFTDSMIPADSGKFLETRRKQADGSWPYETDMWSSDITPPAPAPAMPARH